MRVKNDSGSTQAWVGQSITNQSVYDISASEIHLWKSNDKVITDLSSLDLLIGDGTSYKTTTSEAINFLMGVSTEPVDTLGRKINTPAPFAYNDNYRFRGKGFSGTATKNTTTNIDCKVTEERWLNGVELIIKDNVHGDYVKFQVVDVDNTLGYGAGTVLDEFASTWNIAADVSRQGPYIIPYPAKILINLYLRVVYVSIGTSNDVSVLINIFLHKKS